jgi:hypothetical protein
MNAIYQKLTDGLFYGGFGLWFARTSLGYAVVIISLAAFAIVVAAILAYPPLLAILGGLIAASVLAAHAVRSRNRATQPENEAQGSLFKYEEYPTAGGSSYSGGGTAKEYSRGLSSGFEISRSGTSNSAGGSSKSSSAASGGFSGGTSRKRQG